MPSIAARMNSATMPALRATLMTTWVMADGSWLMVMADAHHRPWPFAISHSNRGGVQRVDRRRAVGCRHREAARVCRRGRVLRRRARRAVGPLAAEVMAVAEMALVTRVGFPPAQETTEATSPLHAASPLTERATVVAGCGAGGPP